MNKNSKIFIAGHRGMVGSSVFRELQKEGYQHLITATHKELDLINQKEVKDFFEKEKPEYVFLCAAKVGGIIANSTYPADFIYQNLCIQNNVLQNSFEYNIKRLLFLGSSCIYPKNCPQPIKEEYLLTGQLEPTNSAYAIAKIAGVEMCRSFNTQHGTQFLSAMPTNLYGINDNYDLHTSHVLPALIRKIYEAKTQNKNEIVIWGTGTPKREFLFSDDLAEACVFLMNLDEIKFKELILENYYPLINIGCGEDLTIKELATTIAKVIDFKGDFKFDTSKPDGTMQKLLNVSKINNIGWKYKIKLKDGIQLAYDDFLKKLNFAKLS